MCKHKHNGRFFYPPTITRNSEFTGLTMPARLSNEEGGQLYSTNRFPLAKPSTAEPPPSTFMRSYASGTSLFAISHIST